MLKIDVGKTINMVNVELYRSYISHELTAKFWRIVVTRKVFGIKWDVALIRFSIFKKFIYIWLSPPKNLQMFFGLRDKNGKCYPAFSIGYLGMGIKNI